MTKPKTIKETRKVIAQAWRTRNPLGGVGFDGMRAEEIASWLGLDVLRTFKALDQMVKFGSVVTRTQEFFVNPDNL